MIATTQEECNDRIRDYAKKKIQNAGAKGNRRRTNSLANRIPKQERGADTIRFQEGSRISEERRCWANL